MIPLKIDISLLDGYFIRNIVRKEKDRLEKELNKMDEYSAECACLDITKLARIAKEFNDAIIKWEKENK